VVGPRGDLGTQVLAESPAEPVAPQRAALLVCQDAPSDAVEPETGFAIGWSLFNAAPRHQEGVGDHVGSILCATRSPKRIAQQGVPVLLVQRDESLLVLDVHRTPF
jgi:hypothetical protein